MLSKKSKYGLKAMLELAAEDAGQRPMQASELADRQRLPKKFLEAILLELTRHGLLQSKLGRSGGYVLARRPGDITVGEIIRILEGPLALIPCVSKTAYRRCDECLDEQTCGVAWRGRRCGTPPHPCGPERTLSVKPVSPKVTGRRTWRGRCHVRVASLARLAPRSSIGTA